MLDKGKIGVRYDSCSLVVPLPKKSLCFIIHSWGLKQNGYFLRINLVCICYYDVTILSVVIVRFSWTILLKSVRCYSSEMLEASCYPEMMSCYKRKIDQLVTRYNFDIKLKLKQHQTIYVVLLPYKLLSLKFKTWQEIGVCCVNMNSLLPLIYPDWSFVLRSLYNTE